MAPVYVLDACVLYPVVLRDLLLTLAALDAFEPRWTEAILDEMTRNCARRPSRHRPSAVRCARRQRDASGVSGRVRRWVRAPDRPDGQSPEGSPRRCRRSSRWRGGDDVQRARLRQRGTGSVASPSSLHRSWSDNSSQRSPAWWRSRCGRWRRARSGRRCRRRMSSRRSSASKASESSKIRYKCWSNDPFNATTRMALLTIFELGMSRNRSGRIWPDP